MPGNLLAWNLLSAMDPGMFDFGGALNVDLVRFTFEIWLIPDHLKMELLTKIMAYTGAMKTYLKNLRKPRG